jgi:hypothetical protein
MKSAGASRAGPGRRPFPGRRHANLEDAHHPAEEDVKTQG